MFCWPVKKLFGLNKRKKEFFGGVLRNFAKFLTTLFFQRILLVAASERVNADEAAHLRSVAVRKKDISGEI